MNISYDPLVWDLNPEGIGVQPMIANIDIAFNYIGGSSLEGPVNQLQNAVRNNFFANSNLYNKERSKVLKVNEIEETIDLHPDNKINTLGFEGFDTSPEVSLEEMKPTKYDLKFNDDYTKVDVYFNTNRPPEKGIYRVTVSRIDLVDSQKERDAFTVIYDGQLNGSTKLKNVYLITIDLIDSTIKYVYGNGEENPINDMTTISIPYNDKFINAYEPDTYQANLYDNNGTKLYSVAI
jgi:hypothetical protein